MYIIVGLGNPTRQYEGTKHNVGFDTVCNKNQRDYLEKCAVYRCFPAPFHRTGNFPFGSNHHRRYPAGMLERAGIGVHVFPCRSGYVRREPFKTGKTRLCLYRC